MKKCTARKIIFCTGLTRAAKAGQKYIVQSRLTNQQGPLSFVLFEFTFTSVSTVSRGHPSLVFLDVTLHWECTNIRKTSYRYVPQGARPRFERRTYSTIRPAGALTNELNVCPTGLHEKALRLMYSGTDMVFRVFGKSLKLFRQYVQLQTIPQ